MTDEEIQSVFNEHFPQAVTKAPSVTDWSDRSDESDLSEDGAALCCVAAQSRDSRTKPIAWWPWAGQHMNGW